MLGVRTVLDDFVLVVSAPTLDSVSGAGATQPKRDVEGTSRQTHWTRLYVAFHFIVELVVYRTIGPAGETIWECMVSDTCCISIDV